MNSLGWIFAFSERNLNFVLDFPYPFFSPPLGGRVIIHCCICFCCCCCLFVVGELLFPPGIVGEVCPVGFSSLWHPRSSPSSPEMCPIPWPLVAGICWDETGLGPALAQLTVAFCQSPFTLKLPLPSIPCLCDQVFVHFFRNKDSTGIPSQWKR